MTTIYFIRVKSHILANFFLRRLARLQSPPPLWLLQSGQSVCLINIPPLMGINYSWSCLLMTAGICAPMCPLLTAPTKQEMRLGIEGRVLSSFNMCLVIESLMRKIRKWACFLCDPLWGLWQDLWGTRVLEPTLNSQLWKGIWPQGAGEFTIHKMAQNILLQHRVEPHAVVKRMQWLITARNKHC